jgi:hypothetical protein
MSESEASACLDRIRAGLDNIRKELVDLHEREGWRALGHASLRECLQREFSNSTAYLYRQLNSGLLENRLSLGEVGSHKESHLRPLIEILSDDNDILRAYDAASGLAEEPTAKHFQMAAMWIFVQQNASGGVWERMQAGSLSPRAAYLITRETAEMPPRLMTVCNQVSDPNLIPMLRGLYHEDSETWGEIEATHHIPSVDEQIPLGEASAANLRAWLNIASNEHRAVAIENNRDYWDQVKLASDNVIQEARKVSGYPDLDTAIQAYDRILSQKTQ